MSVKTIKSMVDWIEENLEEKPTLEKLSGYVGYSSFYCSAKFHEYVGISFQDYVKKRKLALAAYELKNTNLKILDVAVKYGFSSHEAFTRAFIKVFGCSPYQYRKENHQIFIYERPVFTD